MLKLNGVKVGLGLIGRWERVEEGVIFVIVTIVILWFDWFDFF